MVEPAENAQTVFVSFKNLCQAPGRFCGHCYCKFCQELPLLLNRHSVGATAAASVNAGAAMAQDATVSSAAPGTGVQQGTVYMGDVIQGKKAISALDVKDLEPGKHFFYFQGVQMPTGQHWYVFWHKVDAEWLGPRAFAIKSPAHSWSLLGASAIP